MPPRKKRGANTGATRGSNTSGTRGKRGRPRKETKQSEPSEAFIVPPDESSKSSESESTKPVETKIHKKFGKYQVPDEVPQIVSAQTAVQNDPLSCSPSDNKELENEELVDSTAVDPLSNEADLDLSQKLEQLDVAEETVMEVQETEDIAPTEFNDNSMNFDIVQVEIPSSGNLNKDLELYVKEEEIETTVVPEIQDPLETLSIENEICKTPKSSPNEQKDDTEIEDIKEEPPEIEVKTEDVEEAKPIESPEEPLKPIIETPEKSRKSKKSSKPPRKSLKSPKEEKSSKKESKSSKGSKKKQKETSENDEETNIRRSSRIKSISTQKVRSRGKGLVRKDLDLHENNSNSSQSDDKSMPPPNFPVPSTNSSTDLKPVKVKSRWRRSSELEMNCSGSTKYTSHSDKMSASETLPEKKREKKDEEVEKRLKQFIHLKENQYLTERISCKEAKKMICDCFLTQEEIDHGEYGCGDDCLNRLLMIECGNLCTVGDRCTNKRFQRGRTGPCEAFNTENKGLGIRATANIPSGDFILEYVGEVLDADEFETRAGEYSKDKNQHYYFMSLRADAVIDATMKGNISRFINHSCDPNAETQKWTVNGELRIGFFSNRTIHAGEEITFDYQFQRYGKEAQKCLCGASTCRGWLGEEPDDEDDEDEEEDEEEEEEEEEEISSEVKGANKDVNKTPETVKKVIKKERPAPKREKKPRLPKPIRRVRKEKIFEDSSIDDEIESLETTGLKNQLQTLKLSRLMVRAKEVSQRTRLLRLLKNGEFPCRRLFLDYHGLRLIHGWMTDAQSMVKENPKIENLRLLILQTLSVLPIPNKTMLQDSKVLSTVESWSKNKKNVESPEQNSENNSPKDITDEKSTETDEKPSDKKTTLPPLIIDEDEESVRKSVGYEVLYRQVLPHFTDKTILEELLTIFDEDFVPLDVPIIKQTVEAKEYDVLADIVALASKLLEEWSSLKEIFKIPKKERIEQMKEHEREADKRYKALCDQEIVDRGRRESRYRSSTHYRSTRAEIAERSNHMDYKDRKHDRNVHVTRHMSKHERRKLFAMQVEKAEEEKRRKQQEMWRQNCMMVASDPRLQPTPTFDNRDQYVWNPQMAAWQTVPFGIPRGAENALGPTLGIPPGLLPPNVIQPNMPPASMGTMPPMPNIPPKPSVPYQEEDPSKVKFLGPIPPPVALPPKWKSAKDKYGRPYYYHVKIRKSQWEPPPPMPKEEEDEVSDMSSSSETSSLSSDSSSEDSDSDEIDDTRLMLEIRNKFKKLEAQKQAALLKKEQVDAIIKEPIKKSLEVVLDEPAETTEEAQIAIDSIEGVEAAQIVNEIVDPPVKKRRAGLVQEHIISPRSEDSRNQFREDIRKYKQNKEMVRKQKVMIIQQAKKHAQKPAGPGEKSRAERPDKKISVKTKLRDMETNCEVGKKIKEVFRSQMASVMVHILNHYRKSDCKEGRITSTEDFKHLARKLTHFVMIKELKHCDKIENLQCTESVKVKAKEFVRKYMAKFGEVYQKPPDDVDY